MGKPWLGDKPCGDNTSGNNGRWQHKRWYKTIVSHGLEDVIGALSTFIFRHPGMQHAGRTNHTALHYTRFDSTAAHVSTPRLDTLRLHDCVMSG